MFIQVLEGKVADAEALRGHVDRWRSELRPEATGYLGTTAGVTSDGTFIGLVRFESEEAAQANSGRPEQGAWWAEASKSFEGDVAFSNCSDVDTFGGGGSDDAGFVQVIMGQADRAALQAAGAETDKVLQQTRPDVLGGVVAWAGGGRFIQAVYFSSEAEARAGEKAEPASEEERQAWERMSAAMQPDRFLDLTEPWLYSA
jgi:hypothetical protein